MANLGSEGERILQKKVGSENKASAFYDKQLLDYLNPYMREFILKQEMVFIATADSKGECDCSVRAGKQGFVRVLNKKTLLYPEYRGNGLGTGVPTSCLVIRLARSQKSRNWNMGLPWLRFYKKTKGEICHVLSRKSIRQLPLTIS